MQLKTPAGYTSGPSHSEHLFDFSAQREHLLKSAVMSRFPHSGHGFCAIVVVITTCFLHRAFFLSGLGSPHIAVPFFPFYVKEKAGKSIQDFRAGVQPLFKQYFITILLTSPRIKQIIGM